ncbi:MAG: hypothetical protein N0C88_13195 [Candidatus Thiodiazotropha lotti]|uniref:Uncharacterized protein n=1 Tax=Candidatus Thiodiazotropha lotti TaxID=2792787 RepID=A0A9E4K5R7_9GAMM|nr:hypothetical protein [Candidatus Thiodiazotropha lotti]MCW4204259.1 hypothetical protein [Candidatus Thiodiazotropha lotti]
MLTGHQPLAPGIGMVLHTNHPNELSPALAEACEKSVPPGSLCSTSRCC